MRIEQAVDGSANQAVVEVVERALVLLKVRGAQAVADYHVIAFENLIYHGWGRIGWVGVIAIGHDVHVGVDVLEHSSNRVAFALPWLLADDCVRIGCDLSRAVGGVVVIHVDIGVWQR